MRAELVIHFDDVDLWWAEITGVPGFTASAPSLTELRAVVSECLPELSADVGEAITIASETLADAVPAPPVPDPSVTLETQERLILAGSAPGTRLRIPVPA